MMWVMGKRAFVVAAAVLLALGLGFAGGWVAHRPPATVALPSPATVALPSTGQTGTISGTFVAVGGPTNSRYPLQGSLSVTLVDSLGPLRFYVPVGPDGAFSVAVRPGTYAVFGRLSPTFNGGKATCAAERNPVKVPAGADVVVNVVCNMR